MKISKTLKLLGVTLILCASAYANPSAHVSCEVGGQHVSVSGLTSSTYVQASYPGCTITVYLTGTTTKATLYSDNTGSPTPLSNPFTADATGNGLFYTTNGRYDIVLSGGGLGAPTTIKDVSLLDISSPATVDGWTLTNATVSGTFSGSVMGTTISASGGFTGNLTGNVLGNVTGSASQLESKTWEIPGTIGSTTPNTAVFTTTNVKSLNAIRQADQFSGGNVTAQLDACLADTAIEHCFVPSLMGAGNASATPTAGKMLWDFRNGLLILSTTGTYTNSQQNDIISTPLNGVNFGTEYSTQQAGNHATESFAAGGAVPNTSTVWQFNGLAGYGVNSSTTTQAVGVYGQCRSAAANAACLGANFLAATTPGQAANIAAGEFDLNMANAGDSGSVGTFVLGPGNDSAVANGLVVSVQSPTATHHLTTGLVISNGATGGGVSSPGISVGAKFGTTSVDNQGINFVSKGSSTGAADVANLATVGASGNLQLTFSNSDAGADANAGLIAPYFYGVFQDLTGTNSAHTGTVRLVNTGAISWRNFANNGDLPLGVNNSNQAIFNGKLLANLSDGQTFSSLQTFTSGVKIGSGGSTILDSRALVQAVYNCGSTSTCANTTNLSEWTIHGNVALVSASPSTVTVTGISPAFTSTSTYDCTCTPEGATAAIAAGGCAVTKTSASSITLTGPNTVTTVVDYSCTGH